MITNYPEKASLKEVFSTNFSVRALRSICKENGVFLLSPDKEALIRDAHLFYWGYSEINKISNIMDEEKNYKKSFRLKVDYEQSDEQSNCFDDFYAALTTYRTTQASTNGVTFDRLHIDTIDDERVLTGEVSYQRKKPGKVELLNAVTQHFSFSAKMLSDQSVNIDFIFNDRWDINIAKQIVNAATVTSEQFKEPSQISLKMLSVPERVALFDTFFRYTFEDWRLDTIQNIKISDVESLPEAEDQEELEDSILSGIKSALLSGTGLRSNPIVIQAVDKGYFFPKATIMFEHKREAEKILLDIAFNSDDLLLEINMVATYEVEDGRSYKHPMLPEDQTEILQYFHDVMQQIYKGIIAARE